jgi:serine/threonine protein phosphatase 1
LQGQHPAFWLQGGKSTADSYIRHANREVYSAPKMGGWDIKLTKYDLPKTHIDFWVNHNLGYLDEGSKSLFIHAGIDRTETFKENDKYDLIWNRSFFRDAMDSLHDLDLDRPPFVIKEHFNNIFIGHSPTLNYVDENGPITKPIFVHNIINLDTGAGFSGPLTIMNVNTKEYWQSDIVSTLYPNERGRM